MRARRLISMTHLPTISETGEMLFLGGSHAQAEEPLAGLDEYVQSISQLAQPSSLSSGLPCPCQNSQNKPDKPQRARAKVAQSGVALPSPEKVQDNAASLQDITAQFNQQHSPLGLTGCTDPLAWLFGLSEAKEQSPGLRRRVSPAPCYSQTATDTGCPAAPQQTARGNLSAPSDPSSAAQKLSGPAPPLERRCRWQRSRRRPAFPSCVVRGRPSRAQSTRLPVIYEL
ncbi:protein DEPP1 [Gopherus flavomarginatus]|uniref:protein DEPP1 n=1 Tax=Gopherus flavomarginatus TaxID=286002 RepID=UPI0021CBBEE8|nr:protein DEPP1 [Gopherus flavomarginatus]XP_050816297.1 protein DEPP1 [Gopherus flavomarginatus]